MLYEGALRCKGSDECNVCGPVPGTEQALSKCQLLLLTVIGATGITEVSLVSKCSDVSTHLRTAVRSTYLHSLHPRRHLGEKDDVFSPSSEEKPD